MPALIFRARFIWQRVTSHYSASSWERHKAWAMRTVHCPSTLNLASGAKGRENQGFSALLRTTQAGLAVIGRGAHHGMFDWPLLSS